MATLFVITSDVETGYWSETQGWVMDVEIATTFTDNERLAAAGEQTTSPDVKKNPILLRTHEAYWVDVCRATNYNENGD